MTAPVHVRTLFLSDIHLGTSGARADLLLDFLRRYEADSIYLVGDIVDGWRLKRSWHWPQSHNDVVQKILRRARKGAKVIYVPGNHDEFLRDYIGLAFGGVEIRDRAIFESVSGKRYLVIHGDFFDVVVAHARWLALLGDWAYETALKVSSVVSFVRRKLGLPYWSLSAWAKHRVKRAVNFIGEFESCLAAEARKEALDGVICGHIHHAVIESRAGVDYLNTGDWVESCTAIVEHRDGRMELVRYADLVAEPAPQAQPQLALAG